MKKNNKLLLIIAVAVLIAAIVYWKRDAIKTELQKLKDGNKTDDKKDNTTSSNDTGNSNTPTPPPAGDEFPLTTGSKGANVSTLQTNLNKFLQDNQPVTGFLGSITAGNVYRTFLQNHVTQQAFNSLQALVNKDIKQEIPVNVTNHDIFEGWTQKTVKIHSIDADGKIHAKDIHGDWSEIIVSDF